MCFVSHNGKDFYLVRIAHFTGIITNLEGVITIWYNIR